MRIYCLLFFMLFSINVFAGKGIINFVETTVTIDKSGQTRVTYKVQYKVTSGELHGFYFSERSNLVIEGFSDKSFAIDDQGNRYKLDISKVSSGKWDIILANGAGISSGNVTYVFFYKTNFNQAGYLINIEKEDEQLYTVFNWFPTIWNEADSMKYYKLEIILPKKVKRRVFDLKKYYTEERVIVLEKFMEEKYLIEYKSSKKRRLMIVLRKDKPGNFYQMNTRFYIPENWFNL